MSKEQNKSGRLINKATKTPRTQAAIKTYGDYMRSEDAVPIEFAEQLETELAEAQAEVERLKTELRDNSILTTWQVVPAEMLVDDLTAEIERKDNLIEQMREEISRLKRCCNCEYANHKFEVCEHPDNEPETFMDGVCDLWSHNI